MTEPQRLGDILVIDDEPMNILALKGVLSRAGYAVASASSGPAGLAMAKRDRPDMVLLDVMMPGQSGFDTCRQLKNDAGTAHIPVIFVTCLGELADKLAGLDLGAVDYITKPFIAEEVVARVRAHMNFKRQQGTIIDAQARRLDQVHAAQLALLTSPDSVPEAQFAVHYLPVLEAGGDFYDVVSFGGGRAAYFVADVSGHDLGASFITSSLKALFRQHAAVDKRADEILAAMNRILCAITSDEVYLTAVCLMLDRPAGTYALSSAAHPPVLARLRGETRCLSLAGLPLGMFEDAGYDVLGGSITQGDRFYLYTDGLAENAGRYATSGEFQELLRRSCEHNSVMPLPNAVVNLVRDMAGEDAPVRRGAAWGRCMTPDGSLAVAPELRRSFSASTENVERFIAGIHGFLAERNLNGLAFDMELLAREALLNAVQHGSGADASKMVHAVLSFHEGRLTLVVRDEGCGWNWRDVSEQPPAPESESGRGLFIIRKYADEFFYNNPGNELTIVKRVPAEVLHMNDDGAISIVLGPRLTAQNVPALRETLRGRIAQGAPGIRLDCSQLESIDSMGIGLLVATHNSLSKLGCALSLGGVRYEVYQLLTLMRLDKYFSIIPAGR